MICLRSSQGSPKSTIKIDRLIRSKRRTIGIQVKPDATLVVRAPKSSKIEDIERVVIKHTDWIRKAKERALLNLKIFPPKRFIAGEVFLFLGQSLKLNFVDNQDIILIANGGFYLSSKYQSVAWQVLVAWYKYQAKKIIIQRVKFYAIQNSLKYSRIGITNASRRWGSCSHKGNLNFSWRLVMAPLEVLDYVVAHELAHLKERNHSKRFWNQVETIFPDYQKQRQWLRENEKRLTF
jgi:predicted metal-dependent hydrolase